MNLRLLFISSYYGDAAAGSVQDWVTLIHELETRGHVCRVITHKSQQIVGSDNVIKTSESYLDFILAKEVLSFKPDFVLMQHEWSWLALYALRNIHIPKIYFDRIYGDITKNVLLEYFVDIIIVPSTFSQKNIYQQCRVQSTVFPCFVKHPMSVHNRKRNYITIVNPLKIKGGTIFRQIALALPSMKFLAVIGWSDIKGHSFEHMRLAYYDGIDFTNIRNIKFIKPTSSMDSVYSRSKIVLIPSIIPETYSRVAVESILYGTPVIASRIGALQETIQSCGLLIKNINNINAWVKAIEEILDPIEYENYQKECVIYGQEYSLIKNIERFETMLYDYLKKKNKIKHHLQKSISLVRFRIKRAIYHRI